MTLTFVLSVVDFAEMMLNQTINRCDLLIDEYASWIGYWYHLMIIQSYGTSGNEGQDENIFQPSKVIHEGLSVYKYLL